MKKRRFDSLFDGETFDTCWERATEITMKTPNILFKKLMLCNVVAILSIKAYLQLSASTTIIINFTQHNDSLYKVPLNRESHFILYYGICHYCECHHNERHYAEYHYAKCHYVEHHYDNVIMLSIIMIMSLCWVSLW